MGEASFVTRIRRRGLIPELLVAAILALAIPGASRAAIFGLLDTGELYWSTNGGAAWSPLAALPIHDAVGLAAGNSTSQLFIMTRSGTVYSSANAGASWSATGVATASDVASFTINYDGSVLALTESGTLYRSADGGVTFQGLAALTGSKFVALVRGPLGRLYVLSRTGEVFESLNQGSTWSAVGAVSVSNAVSIRRRVSELYVLTETGEIYRSGNYGRAWVPVGAITASNMRAIVDNGSSLLAAAETGEIYQSSNGAAWGAVGAINQLNLVALGSDTPLATGIDLDEGAPRWLTNVPYPNPTSMRSGSTFSFSIPRAGSVALELYDIRGRRVDRWGPAPFEAGPHEIPWRPTRAAAGVYFARVILGSGHTLSVKWSLVD